MRQEDVVIIVVSILCIIGFIFIFKKSKSEKEYDQKINENLKDEYLINPKTGTKITIEQAESGHWIEHNNEFRTVPEKELNKLMSESEKQAEIGLNYLRASKEYRSKDLSDQEIVTLSETTILSKYDDWSYSNTYSFNQGLVFLPAPEIRANNYSEDDYSESHLMFWCKIKNIKGHYYLREQTFLENIIYKLKDSRPFKLANYTPFIITESPNIKYINEIVQLFNDEKGFEIEIDNENLFVKTLKIANLNDIKRIERCITKVINLK